MSKTKSDISKSIMEVIDALTAEKNNKLERLRRITDNPEILSKIDSIALSQEDLYDILENAAQDGREKLTVYLLGRRFAVPYNVGNVKYIGLELYIGLEPGEFSRPVLALSSAEKNISLKEKGIAVENCALLAATRDKLSASESEELETTEGRTATKNRLRLVFDETTAYKPIIANMILETGTPVNLLYANMDALLDEQKGQMVICLSDKKEEAERQKAYLIKEGVNFTEIPEDSDYYDYPLHGFREEVTE